jgi:hypothetical protein
LGQFSKNYRTFYTKCSQKYGFGNRDPGSKIRDPGSGKNLFLIPDPGVKKAPDPGSGSATLVAAANFSMEFEPLFNREGTIVYRKEGNMPPSQHLLTTFSSPCFGVKIVYNYGHRRRLERYLFITYQAGQKRHTPLPRKRTEGKD